jgi:pimeloyl-ACP methyl ester carboxylesterase
LKARPGLMINAEYDHAVGSDEQTQMMADLAGARVAHLAGVGHWWMCEDPAAGATALETFWESLQ